MFRCLFLLDRKAINYKNKIYLLYNDKFEKNSAIACMRRQGEWMDVDAPRPLT
jgi:hypothetical protein